jgi:hypothetical protein
MKSSAAFHGLGKDGRNNLVEGLHSEKNINTHQRKQRPVMLCKKSACGGNMSRLYALPDEGVAHCILPPSSNALFARGVEFIKGVVCVDFGVD